MRLTRGDTVFLGHVHVSRVLRLSAGDSVNAKANGVRGQVQVALSDGITGLAPAGLAALRRQEEPEVIIRLYQVPYAHACPVVYAAAADHVEGKPLRLAQS